MQFLTSHSLQQGASEEALGGLHDNHIRVCLYIAHREYLRERILSERTEGEEQTLVEYDIIYNKSTTGADASVEALKLYHMKLTV